MIRAIALSLCLTSTATGQDREWLDAKVNGQLAKVYGWRDTDGKVRYHPEENPHLPSPPPAPPAADPSLTDGGSGESSGNLPASPDSSGDLPAYALNGVIESNVPAERVIYTNVPSLAPKLAREYGVEVRTEGAAPVEYPEPEADATRIFVGPAVVVSALILLAVRFRRP